MKSFLNFIGNFLTVIVIICEIIEFSAVPLLFIFLGVINSMPWQYYVISIGIYVALLAVLELFAYLIGKALGKKFVPLFVRIFRRHTGNSGNADQISSIE